MSNSPLPVLRLLACSYDGEGLQQEGNWVVCPRGHQFPIVENVPVLLRDDVVQTIGIASESLRLARLHAEGGTEDPLFTESLGLSHDERRQVRQEIAKGRNDIDPVISYLVGATNGLLYRHLIGSLTEYPIPVLPLPAAQGELLLDVGCSWGRWSIAAANKGYRVVGLDPSLGAVLAAKRLTRRLGIPFEGVVGDARYLPFRSGGFNAAFSYSVLQHFSKPDTSLALREIRRTLPDGGVFAIQMASAWGVRSFQHQARRRFREPVSFEVRYWSPLELKSTFSKIFGDVRVAVDCYFGLGLQASDMDIMPAAKKAVLVGSELLKALADRFAPLAYTADSLLLKGRVITAAPCETRPLSKK